MRRNSTLGFSSLLLCALSLPALADEPGLSFREAEPLPQMNARFERTEGWIGADAAYSVALSPERRLWLFDDTWVGSIRDGKRAGATMVNNSVALQDGIGDAEKLRFVIRSNPDQKAAALFTPADGAGWFWPQAGAYLNKKLYLWLSQIEKTADPGVFGFRQVGQVLAVVENPNDDPASWRLEQHKLPFTVFGAERELTFGTAVLEDGDYLYVFGTDEEMKPIRGGRHLIVARVPVSAVEDFRAWKFYDGEGWQTESRAARRLVGGMAGECSVSYLADFKRYVLVYTDGGL